MRLTSKRVARIGAGDAVVGLVGRGGGIYWRVGLFVSKPAVAMALVSVLCSICFSAESKFCVVVSGLAFV